MKGRFTVIRIIGRDRPLNSEINKEIPVAPPSMKSLGNKNPSKPKPALEIPIKINRISLILVLSNTLNLYMALP